MDCIYFNPLKPGPELTILPMEWVVIRVTPPPSLKKKKKKKKKVSQNWVSFPPQLSSFSTRLLIMLVPVSDAAQEKTWETIEYHPIVKFTQLCSKFPLTARLNFACDWLALDRDISFGSLTSPKSDVISLSRVNHHKQSSRVLLAGIRCKAG